ncbi:MAG: aminotransferase class IV, partial [Chlamydiia bacterium]|nr:aminotransferase class IV [Chlamydiia bacterium]
LGFDFSMEFEDFRSVLFELARKNAPKTDIYIRPFIFSNDEFLPPRLPGLTFQLAIYMMGFDVYFPHDKGLRMMVSSWRKVPDNVISTKAKAGGAYLNSALATTDAIKAGYDEALVCDESGCIAEAAVANMIMMYRGVAMVPSLGSPLLEGITMRTALDFLREEGMEPHVERIDRSMVYTCDELMLTGTAAQVIFANSVDGRVIGDGTQGPVAKMLRQKFQDVLNKQHPRHAEWVEELKL